MTQRNSDGYKASGHRMETIAYLSSEDSAPWFRLKYEYDDNGRMRRLSHYGRDPAGNLKLSHVVTYTRHIKGDEEEVRWLDPNGELRDRLSYSNYKHDRRGNWVERTEARYQVYDKNQPKEQWGTIYRVISYY